MNQDREIWVERLKAQMAARKKEQDEDPATPTADATAADPAPEVVGATTAASDETNAVAALPGQVA